MTTSISSAILTCTASAYSANAYTYFRLIVPTIWNNQTPYVATQAALGQWIINFQAGGLLPADGVYTKDDRVIAEAVGELRQYHVDTIELLREMDALRNYITSAPTAPHSPQTDNSAPPGI